MSDLLSQLTARRGYARQQTGASFDEAWQQAAGAALARQSRVGQVKRGALEVIVANSALAQELSYQKRGIITKLTGLLPDEQITDLRVRVGPVE